MWMVSAALAGLVGLLASPPAAGAARCPGEAEIAGQLGRTGTGWLTACRREAGGRLLLAAFQPPEGRTNPPELVVALAPAGKPVALKVASAQEPRLAEITPAAEQWALAIDRLRLGESLVRVRLTASWGGNQLYTHEVVALLRESDAGLVPLWTGLGDWKENRFDICLLSARASFRRLPGGPGGGPGKLERLTRVTRRRGPALVDEAPAREVQKECLAPPPRRDIFDLP